MPSNATWHRKPAFPNGRVMMRTRVCRNHSLRPRGPGLTLYFIRKSPRSGASHLDLRLLVKYLFSISHCSVLIIPPCTYHVVLFPFLRCFRIHNASLLRLLHSFWWSVLESNLRIAAFLSTARRFSRARRSIDWSLPRPRRLARVGYSYALIDWLRYARAAAPLLAVTYPV